MKDIRERVTRSHRGAWAEACAVKFLLEQGYEVFRNVSAHGPVDLVGWREDALELFDVKTVLCRERLTGLITRSAKYPRPTEEQASRGVFMILVYPDGFCEIEGITTPHPEVVVASLFDRPPQGDALKKRAS